MNFYGIGWPAVNGVLHTLAGSVFSGKLPSYEKHTPGLRTAVGDVLHDAHANPFDGRFVADAG